MLFSILWPLMEEPGYVYEDNYSEGYHYNDAIDDQQLSYGRNIVKKANNQEDTEIMDAADDILWPSSNMNINIPKSASPLSNLKYVSITRRGYVALLRILQSILCLSVIAILATTNTHYQKLASILHAGFSYFITQINNLIYIAISCWIGIFLLLLIEWKVQEKKKLIRQQNERQKKKSRKSKRNGNMENEWGILQSRSEAVSSSESVDEMKEEIRFSSKVLHDTQSIINIPADINGTDQSNEQEQAIQIVGMKKQINTFTFLRSHGKEYLIAFIERHLYLLKIIFDLSFFLVLIIFTIKVLDALHRPVCSWPNFPSNTCFTLADICEMKNLNHDEDNENIVFPPGALECPLIQLEIGASMAFILTILFSLSSRASIITYFLNQERRKESTLYQLDKRQYTQLVSSRTEQKPIEENNENLQKKMNEPSNGNLSLTHVNDIEDQIEMKNRGN